MKQCRRSYAIPQTAEEIKLQVLHGVLATPDALYQVWSCISVIASILFRMNTCQFVCPYAL